jgi:hypothetical protein
MALKCCSVKRRLKGARKEAAKRLKGGCKEAKRRLKGG